jgi:hypothetical protein
VKAPAAGSLGGDMTQALDELTPLQRKSGRQEQEDQTGRFDLPAWQGGSSSSATL